MNSNLGARSLLHHHYRDQELKAGQERLDGLGGGFKENRGLRGLIGLLVFRWSELVII
jgi:hypothetical protein